MAEQLSLFNLPSSRTERQQAAVDAWVNNKCRGTINAAVGFGKTRMGLMSIQRFLHKNPNKRVLVVVPSDPIRLQWIKELQDWNLSGEVRTMYDTSRNQYECDLLVLDELGYIPLNKEGAELLFQVISMCYENKSIVITTNLQFGQWNHVFGDPILTEAVIDRLIHHSHLLLFTGDSFRYKESLLHG